MQGVTVLGLLELIRGLLLADDLSLLADSHVALQNSLDKKSTNWQHHGE